MTCNKISKLQFENLNYLFKKEPNQLNGMISFIFKYFNRLKENVAYK